MHLPVARALVGPILAALTALSVGHCNSGCKTFDSVNNSSDDAVLQRCREQGRKAKDAGASTYSAADVYYRCTEDAGLRNLTSVETTYTGAVPGAGLEK